MSLKETAHIYRSLQPEDIRTLIGIELGLGRHAHVPKEEIVKYANLPEREIGFRLNRLDKLGLVMRIPREKIGYEGHVINYQGYDCLALDALVKASVISAIGKALGVGKESDVYEGLTPTGQRVVVKFHRLGRTSFRQGSRKRYFVADRTHLTWYHQSKLAAQKEFLILKRVQKAKVSVPTPIAQNRHVVVEKIVEGVELNDVGQVEEPKLLLAQILENIRRAYMEAGVIHADLSKFNILVTSEGRAYIIDWPQAIRVTHPNSKEILERDLHNVLFFFKGRFSVDYDMKHVLSFVQGEAETL